jgi:hypothetical protein
MTTYFPHQPGSHATKLFVGQPGKILLVLASIVWAAAVSLLCSLGKDRIENAASNSSSIVVRLLVSAETCLLCRRLAMTISFKRHITMLIQTYNNMRSITIRKYIISGLYWHSSDFDK